jgi:hypothetical protein
MLVTTAIDMIEEDTKERVKPSDEAAGPSYRQRRP